MTFPTIHEIKRGDKLIADGGFSCIDEDEVLVVLQDEKGLYVICRGPDGRCAKDCRHYLDGQVDDAAGTVVGLRVAS